MIIGAIYTGIRIYTHAEYADFFLRGISFVVPGISSHYLPTTLPSVSAVTISLFIPVQCRRTLLPPLSSPLATKSLTRFLTFCVLFPSLILLLVQSPRLPC
jgi:hypothetical protein